MTVGGEREGAGRFCCLQVAQFGGRLPREREYAGKVPRLQFLKFGGEGEGARMVHFLQFAQFGCDISEGEGEGIDCSNLGSSLVKGEVESKAEFAACSLYESGFSLV